MSTTDATSPGADDDLSPAPNGVAETDDAPGQGQDDLTDDELTELASEDGDGADQPGDAEDETEEFEHGGVKYAVPKALVPALMKDGDYTRKTQELAEGRRQVELRNQAIAAQEAEIGLNREVLQESAKLINAESRTAEIKAALAEYDKVDPTVWAQALAEDKTNGTNLVQQHQLQLQQLQRALAQAEGDERAIKDTITQKKDELAKKTTERSTVGNDLVAEQRKACEAACQRDIPEWEKRRPQIEAFAKENGITDAELQAITDPRLFKFLDLAQIGARAVQAKKTQQRIAPATGAGQPVRRVTPTGSSPRTDPDRMSTEAWMKHRREQIAKKGRR